jgi:hypothetical protein
MHTATPVFLIRVKSVKSGGVKSGTVLEFTNASEKHYTQEYEFELMSALDSIQEPSPN